MISNELDIKMIIRMGDYEMKKIYMILLVCVALTAFVINLTYVYGASGVRLPEEEIYNENNLTSDAVKAKANSIMGNFVFLVQVACIATMVVMGIRYMFSAADVRADLKKSLLTWCIGAVFVFCATTIVGLILNVVSGEQYIDIKPMENNNSNKDSEKDTDSNTGSKKDAEYYWELASDEGLLPASIENKANESISRIEFAEAIYGFAKEYKLTEPEKEPEHKDGVIDEEDITQEQEDIVLELYRYEIVQGLPGKDATKITFNSSNNITREDAATMIYRLLEKAELVDEDVLKNFDYGAEYNNVSDYAQEAVAYLNKTGLMVGDEKGNLKPKNNILCKETITILGRIYEQYNP